MAIRFISLVMAVSALSSTGASVVAKAQRFYNTPLVGDVFQALDTRGVGTKTTILMPGERNSDNAKMRASARI